MHKLYATHMEYDGSEYDAVYDCDCPIGHDHDEQEHFEVRAARP